MEALEKEKILYEELESLLIRFTSEYDMTVGQVLGILRIVEHGVIETWKEQCDEDDTQS